MKMPDGCDRQSILQATELPNGNVVYSFVLLAPPVPNWTGRRHLEFATPKEKMAFGGKIFFENWEEILFWNVLLFLTEFLKN